MRTLFFLLCLLIAPTAFAQPAQTVNYDARPHACVEQYVVVRFSIQINDKLILSFIQPEYNDLMIKLGKSEKFQIFSLDKNELTLDPAEKISANDAVAEAVSIITKAKAANASFVSQGWKPQAEPCKRLLGTKIVTDPSKHRWAAGRIAPD